MFEGIITKGISGFYYVEIKDKRIIECKARGKFRQQKITPVVGDRVLVDVMENEKGVICEIKERKNLLFRPVVSNIDQAIVVFAVKKPDLNYNLIDKLLVIIEHYDIDAVICLNKSDLDEEGLMDKVTKTYTNAGYKVINTNAKTGMGMDEIKRQLEGKVTVFSGPSGVGKSTISNYVQDNVNMETGTISEKIQRGKNTTRHAELIEVKDGTYIVDTPGFSSIDTSFIEEEELEYDFREFREYLGLCKFQSCRHNKESNCAIKKAVEEGKISSDRYKSYISILDEIRSRRKR